VGSRPRLQVLLAQLRSFCN